MSEKKNSESIPKPKSLYLQNDKSKNRKPKICYYLDLPQSERLLLRKKRYNLTLESEKCVLNQTKICKKNCREFENQDESTVNCRDKCKINEKKTCIRFEDRNDFSKTLSIEIKKRPWENRLKCVVQTYQCYCSKLTKLIDEEKETIKLDRTGLSDGKPLPYQEKLKILVRDKSEFKEHSLKTFHVANNELKGQFLKTFQIQYNNPLSLTARNILSSFTNKYIYYAIDDILYLLNSNKIERDNLLSILYSCMLSLQNDFSVNFFDIWIDSIYLTDTYQTNRFLTDKSDYLKNSNSTNIQLKLHYFIRTPIKKPETIW